MSEAKNSDDVSFRVAQILARHNNSLLTLEASITRFNTIPYVEHELAEMSDKVQRNIQHFDIEKVLDESDIARIVAKNKNDLRKQIMRVYKRYHPDPIVVYTNAFEVFSFITRWKYRDWLPWTLGELVFFQAVDNESDRTATQRYEVLCRIIGRDQKALSRYSRYFRERHSFETRRCSSDFNFPHNLFSRRTTAWS